MSKKHPTAQQLFDQAKEHLDQRQYDKALEGFEQVLALCAQAQELEQRVLLAKAMACKGLALGRQDRPQESLDAYEDLIATFGQTTDPELRKLLALAIREKANILGDLGRHQEALDAYEQVITAFGQTTEPGLRVQVAITMLTRGMTLAKLGRHQEALDALEQGITTFGQGQSPEQRELVDCAIFKKGITLAKLGRDKEALDALEQVITTFGQDQEPNLRELVGSAILKKGMTLAKLGRHQEALDALEQVITTFGQGQEAEQREQVGGAMLKKGAILTDLGRHQEALGAYEQVITTFGQTVEPELRVKVALAILAKGLALADLGRHQEALDALEQWITTFGQGQGPEQRDLVGCAILKKGMTLAKLGRDKEALDAYEQVIATFGQDQEPELQELLGGAMLCKILALAILDRYQEALDFYEEVISTFGQATEPELRVLVANAMDWNGKFLGLLERHQEALDSYEKVIATFGQATEPDLRVLVANAMANKGWTLGKLERRQEALETACQTIELFNQDENAQGPVAHAETNQAMMLQLKGDEDRASELIKSALQRAQRLNLDQNIKSEWLEFLDDVKLPLFKYYRQISKQFDEQERKKIEELEGSQNKFRESFLNNKSNLRDDVSLLFVLRECNSFTPALPDREEFDRGGGYFIWHHGQGIVIDPGYDFLRLLHEAGGRLVDIDHIIITHAHDDHTADFEPLMVLLHQFNTDKGKDATGEHKHKVSLYLSQGAHRKLSGFFALKKDPRIKQVHTLVLAQGCKQEITIADGVELTVLRAYHDDVISADSAVGLGLTIDFGENKKKMLLFTGDTGLLPISYDKDGEPEKYDGDTKETKVVVNKEAAIYAQYPTSFQPVDLVVAHIGSIKKYELQRVEIDWLKSPRFYPNHLGLLGTTILVGQLKPKLAIISEFGSELKELRCKIAAAIGGSLSGHVEGAEDDTNTSVLPGDQHTIYQIDTGKVLCHYNREFQDPAGIEFHPCIDKSDRSHKGICLLPKGVDLRQILANTSMELILKEFKEYRSNCQLEYFKDSQPGQVPPATDPA
jgi:tetratricopeptide (TPR) repeat protein